MKTTRQFLLVSAASVLLSVGVHAQTQMRLQSVIQRVPATGPDATAQKTNNSGTVTDDAAAKFLRCFGTVTDAGGQPVAGATIEYWRNAGRPSPENRAELKNQTNSSANGAFALAVSRNVAQLVARKPGFAPAWAHLNPRKDTEVNLVLTPPSILAGVVVDEADKPVAGAEVTVAAAMCEVPSDNGGNAANYLSGKPAHDAFNTRTGADGHFRVEGLPANATADLAVRVPGKTLRPAPQQQSSGPPSLPYTAGQNDIRLVVEPAGTVEGAVVFEGSVRPFPPVQLMLLPDQPGFASLTGREPATSDADGAFRIADVPGGNYRLRADFGTNAAAHWVAESVPVSVDSRQVTRGVQVSAIRAALLEVAVLQQNDRQPQPRVGVNAYKESFQAGATTGSNGIARLWLPPGDYQVAALRKSGPPDQATATVEAGRTNRIEIIITGPQKISGVVRQPDGHPAAGLPVRMVGAYGPDTTSVKTDDNGRFEWEWNQRQYGQNDISLCLLVRDAEHNLAVAQEIEEGAGPLDLKLEPGLTLAGRAECNGKPVTNATAALVFWTGRRGMWLQDLARTNTPGQYEIPALPPGRKYGVIVSAPGYGQRQLYNLEISAEPGRQELDPVELMPANFKLAGQVLDADDKPVAGVYVNLYGDAQPSAHVQTDREGRFRFEHVCEGRAQLSASDRNGYGNASAEAGDTNVVLRLGQNDGGSPESTSHKLKGTITDPDGKPVAGAQVAVFPGNGPRWTRTGTDGAFNLTWSLQSWQLQSGGPLLVARDPARNLAAIADLPEDTTNLDLKLTPALTVRGLVKRVDDSPLPGAQVGVWLKAGNSYDQFNEQLANTDAQGRYEIKCLPAGAQYIVFASAKGHGRNQQPVPADSETNRAELAPFVLKPADRLVAGQVLNENNKPATGVNVSLNGEDQPNGNVVTDSKGRFRFQVCEGQIRLYAYSQNGGASAQATADAGDTNVVMTLGSRSGELSSTPRRAALKGGPLPNLATVNLAADAVPANQPVLLCLFDASQRPSRHIIRQLNEQAAALRQKNISVVGVQSAVASDEVFNAWKTASPVSFPVGRVTEQSEKSKWATDVTALPWLVLADAGHRVIAEGFSLDELDAQLKALVK